MEKRIAVAIDGPAGSGKSTIAKKFAQILNYVYVDTGAMYRSITLKVLRAGIALADEAEIISLAERTVIELKPCQADVYTNKVYMDGEDVTEEIRTPLVSQNVSQVSKISGVREELVKQQRKMANIGGIVMDGRDIGTVVLPKAELKIYLTASIEERAARRYHELLGKGYRINLEDLQKEIAQRDKIDMEREIAPLKQAEDAVLIDTTADSIEEVTAKIIKIYTEMIKR